MYQKRYSLLLQAFFSKNEGHAQHVLYKHVSNLKLLEENSIVKLFCQSHAAQLK